MEISLSRLANGLFRRSYVIALAALVGAASALAYCMTTEKAVYTAQAVYYVRSYTAEPRAPKYADIGKERVFIDKMGEVGGIRGDGLAAMLNVRAEGDRLIVSAVSADAFTCRDVIDAYTERALPALEEYVGRSDVEIWAMPTGAAASEVPYAKYVIVGLLVGALIGTAALAAYLTLFRKVESAEDIASVTDAAVLAVLPRVKEVK